MSLIEEFQEIRNHRLNNNEDSNVGSKKDPRLSNKTRISQIFSGIMDLIYHKPLREAVKFNGESSKKEKIMGFGAALCITIMVLGGLTINSAYKTEPVPYKSFQNQYMSFQYPDGWRVLGFDDDKTVMIRKDDNNWIQITRLDNESDYRTHQLELIKLDFTDKGIEKLGDTSLEVRSYYPPPQLSQAVPESFMVKDGKYWEVKGTTTYNSQDLIDRTMENLK